MGWLPVKCPHCSASGQIMIPPQSALIIGPCPLCHEFVAIFCGSTLSLSKEILTSGSPDEKRSHLLETLSAFLSERLSEMFAEDTPSTPLQSDIGAPQRSEAAGPPGPIAASSAGTLRTISQAEIDRFVTNELNLIDNKNYFKSIFP